MYVVMKRDPASVAGANMIMGGIRREAEAERIALGHDGTLNGKRRGDAWVMTQEEYDRWHEREIMPFYRD